MTEVIFEKRAGKFDMMLVMHDGAWSQTPCPKQAPIPHDMFHHAVETTLGGRGFLHRHAAGESDGFRMKPEVVSEALERLVETMQADSWSGRPDPTEVIDLYLTTCAARDDAPIKVTVDDIVAIRRAIDDLGVRWALVPIGGRLVLSL